MKFNSVKYFQNIKFFNVLISYLFLKNLFQVVY